jgi:hypothetical protein
MYNLAGKSPDAMALTTRMKAGIDLRERQTRVENCSTLDQETSSKTIRY